MSDDSTPTGHILVADDNRMNRLKLARTLEQQGHSVALAEDGRQALEMLRREPFDVLLLDILMPGMDGFEVLAELKQSSDLRNLPVIVVSALDEIDSVVRCIEMGAEDHLTKPFNPVFLKARLDASLRRKKLRDLEQAYLQQEVTLRQSEKLATLGRLSAGMAHELNNPVAAVLRGVKLLEGTLQQQLGAHLELAAAGLSAEQIGELERLYEVVRTCKESIGAGDALMRSDLESEIEDWLDDLGLDNGWELAPALVTMNYQTEDLERLLSVFGESHLAAALTWLVSGFTLFNVLDEAAEGAGRITEIVKALKSYSYLDQAPVQTIDIHEGLESTLVMFRNRLRGGIAVERDYGEDLPQVEAYASELNQVWTNLIDNALSAMDDAGTLSLRTRREGERVVVEIGDSGPGIPEEVRARVFDPFFTTKPPGEGTGMGLNISHNIVVQKHRGEISVASQPGATRFTISLPLVLEADSDDP